MPLPPQRRLHSRILSMPGAITQPSDGACKRRDLRGERTSWLTASQPPSTFWMPDGVHQVSGDGGLGKPVPFWRAVKGLAIELMGRDVVPGADYALTEVVHCKSRREVGVADAAKECIPRYLRRVVALSPAAVIVVLGSHARNGFRSEFNYSDAGIVSPPLEVEDRLRRIVFLAHPAARAKTKYPRRPTGSDLNVVRQWLRKAERAQRYTWEADDVTITRLPLSTDQPDLCLPSGRGAAACDERGVRDRHFRHEERPHRNGRSLSAPRRKYGRDLPARTEQV
jgi:hypothetical protein